jgi:thiol-disulfide isomerase/thioredoxin
MQLVIERVLLSIMLLLGFGILASTYFHVNRKRANSAARRLGMFSRETGFEAPILLYFWSAGCAQCRPQEQQVELAKAALLREGKVLEVRKFNALEEPELVKSMQVMSVPTTVLVGPQGEVSAWNPGWTPAEKIVSQYNDVALRNATAD